MNIKRIPIKSARSIAAEYGQSHVVVMTFDRKNNRTHVVTYGKSKKDCQEAAQGGNLVKKALGWPERLCNAKPARA